MSGRPVACTCGKLLSPPAVCEWGSWFRCECGALHSTLPTRPAPLEPARDGPPPGWTPEIPLKPASRIDFGRQRVVRIFLTTCRTCRAWLPLDRHATPRFVRCAGCGDRRTLDGEPLNAHLLVPYSQVGALYAEPPTKRAFDEERFSLPTRPAPTRAWLERDEPTAAGRWLVAPIVEASLEPAALGLPPTARVERQSEGWFAPDGGLASGMAVAPGVWFGQSGACEPKSHYAPLDERPQDPAAWEIWADHLEERGEGAAAAWILAASRTNMALADQLGFLTPLVRRGLATVTWNSFGFVERLVIGGDRLRAHPFALDARAVPAVRYLQSLRIELEEPAALGRLAPVLARATLPRSLRRVELSGARGDASQFDAVIHHARASCPWFGA